MTAAKSDIMQTCDGHFEIILMHDITFGTNCKERVKSEFYYNFNKSGYLRMVASSSFYCKDEEGIFHMKNFINPRVDINRFENILLDISELDPLDKEGMQRALDDINNSTFAYTPSILCSSVKFVRHNDEGITLISMGGHKFEKMDQTET